MLRKKEPIKLNNIMSISHWCGMGGGGVLLEWTNLKFQPELTSASKYSQRKVINDIGEID